MKRLLMTCALALPLLALAVPAHAEIKTRDKSQIKFEGMLGKMMGLFGGKAAKEGVLVTTAVKGDRKATVGEERGQIVDLAQEKVYELDLKKKTYEVITFEELRRRMREAEEKARKDAEKEQGKEQPKEKAEQPQKEMEVDFDVKETGQKKQIAGYDTHETIMTITVREKGKKLEDGGGIVMTSDMWLAPEVAGYKEVAEFNQRYWKALEGPGTGALSAEQMAAVMAMYPMVKGAMERMSKEGTKVRGTPLSTTTTVESVKSKEQLAAEAQNAESSGSGGGISGMLARKMMKKDTEVKPRATIFTAVNEVQEISTTVAPADIDIPVGFKEKK